MSNLGECSWQGSIRFKSVVLRKHLLWTGSLTISSINNLDLPTVCGVIKTYMNVHLVVCLTATEIRVD